MRSTIRKTAAAALSVLVSAALFAPSAFAEINGGEGTYGPADDKVVTKFGLGIVFLFPLLLIILSILQHRKEKREDEHLEAQRNRADLAEWHGGW